MLNYTIWLEDWKSGEQKYSKMKILLYTYSFTTKIPPERCDSWQDLFFAGTNKNPLYGAGNCSTRSYWCRLFCILSVVSFSCTNPFSVVVTLVMLLCLCYLSFTLHCWSEPCRVRTDILETRIYCTLCVCLYLNCKRYEVLAEYIAILPVNHQVRHSSYFGFHTLRLICK